jgi:hypothetical protein
MCNKYILVICKRVFEFAFFFFFMYFCSEMLLVELRRGGQILLNIILSSIHKSLIKCNNRNIKNILYVFCFSKGPSLSISSFILSPINSDKSSVEEIDFKQDPQALRICNLNISR